MSAHDDAEERLAPVVPLFGGVAPEKPEPESDAADDWHTTWRGAERPATPVRALDDPAVRFVEAGEGEPDHGDADVDDPEVDARQAEQRLVASLARRGLSVREAGERLRRDGCPRDEADDIIARLVEIGALDDDRLAEQLVHAAVSRKGQGRRAIAQSLAKRQVSREAIDLAIADLPDDDAERALEFARSKARTLVRYDEQTALRRLTGQLGRRGFGGHAAMSAARQALDEARGGARGVRFE
ncbi:regulatory protein RecX [Microbacterium sp. gxy059]|uniref:regulatory protein RecX n=1 Tax=Microbacterium sp. gxy059 TaxID=2957199 RepID=UPI003D96E905